MNSNFLKKTAKETVNIDKSLFKKIFLYSILFCIAFFLIVQLFGAVSSLVSSKIMSAAGVTDIADIDAAALETYSSQISGLLFLFISMGIIFTAIMAYNYSFFENKIWNTIFSKKTDFKNTSKFLGLGISLAVIFSAVLIALFFIIAKLLSSLPKTGAAIFYFAVLFCIYLLYVGYWAFGKTHHVLKSVKSTYSIGIKRLDLTVVQLTAALIIGILLNILLLLFSWMPDFIYLLLSVVALMLYMSWFRLYLTNALKSVKL